jgi:hypothetical protein
VPNRPERLSNLHPKLERHEEFDGLCLRFDMRISSDGLRRLSKCSHESAAHAIAIREPCLPGNDAVLIDRDLRESRLQFTRLTPMSRHTPTIEHPRFR